MGEHISLERALTRMQAIAHYQEGSGIREKRHGFSLSLPSLIILRYHPTIQHREEFINDPARFFSAGFPLLFVIGFSVACLYQMTILLLGLFKIPPGPDSMLVPVFIPGVLLAAALLLPRMTAQLLVPPARRFRYTDPVVVSQVFMVGFAFALYIIENMSQVLVDVLHRVFLIGSPVVYSQSYGYLGMEFPTFHPAMVFITGEFVAVSILGILLISLTLTSLLIRLPAVSAMFRHPVLSFLVLPAFFAGGIVVIALLGSPGLSLGFLAGVLVVLVYGCRKFRKCPVCSSQIPGDFHSLMTCPSCRYDYGWWIKNAK